jgi:hypothetical protein
MVLLSVDTYSWSSASEEDQAAQVGSALVGESASGVDQSTNAIGLESGSEQRAAPSGSSGCGLFGLEELLFAVGGLGAVIRVSEQRAHHGERRDMVEDGAERDGGRLNRGKIWKARLVDTHGSIARTLMIMLMNFDLSTMLEDVGL